MVAHDDFVDANASLEHLLWRNAQYPGYAELMPVDAADGLVVVDYGCGPGNDLVGFSEFSRPDRLVGVDVSPTALVAAKKRLSLHGKSVELVLIREDDNRIPLEANSVDLVHSSGVLHHVEHLESALAEIRRVLKPGGKLHVMVYNYDSIWLHLYTAYIHQIQMKRFCNLTLLDVFRRTTDGPDCPISRCYKPAEFEGLVCKAGFEGGLRGVAISIKELSWLPIRLEAIQNRALPRTHREFLSSLRFNEMGHPVYKDMIAGIDACYMFNKVEALTCES